MYTGNCKLEGFEYMMINDIKNVLLVIFNVMFKQTIVILLLKLCTQINSKEE